jgi:hypothetical protein
MTQLVAFGDERQDAPHSHDHIGDQEAGALCVMLREQNVLELACQVPASSPIRPCGRMQPMIYSLVVSSPSPSSRRLAT